MNNDKRIKEIRRYGARRSSGVGRLIAHLKGEQLNPIESISAYCADCLGWYEDRGDPDCHQGQCPLYPHYASLLERDPISRPWQERTESGMG